MVIPGCIRPPLLLVVLPVLLLAAGCSSLATLVEDQDPPTATVGEHHLATMVLPREDLGLIGDPLRLDPDESGYVDDAHAIEDFHVLQLTEDDLTALGRVNGYQLTYVDPTGAHLQGVYGANSSLDLFEGSSGASGYFDDIVQELSLTGGTVDGRVSYQQVEPFHVGGIGDEARGYRMTAKVEGYDAPYVGSIVVFRYGRLVATASVSHFGGDNMNIETVDLARELEHRIDLSVEGHLIATPVPLVVSEETDAAAPSEN